MEGAYIYPPKAITIGDVNDLHPSKATPQKIPVNLSLCKSLRGLTGDHVFRTGDLGYLDMMATSSDTRTNISGTQSQSSAMLLGNLHITGRLKELIKRGGEQVKQCNSCGRKVVGGI